MNATQVDYVEGGWPDRPDVPGAVIWVSTGHKNAPYPPTQPSTPTGMAIGDMLIRHPEAPQ